MKTNVTPGETPPKISVMQIDQYLKDGVSKSEMAIKYSIKPWEVDEMFKHPFLKGRRPSRKKALSFKFEDDMSENETHEITGIPQGDTMSDTDDEDSVDPNQVTLEDAIVEAETVTAQVITQHVNTNKAIIDILSPKTTEEFVDELIEINDTSIKEDEIELDEDENSFEL